MHNVTWRSGYLTTFLIALALLACEIDISASSPEIEATVHAKVDAIVQAGSSPSSTKSTNLASAPPPSPISAPRQDEIMKLS